MSVLVLPLAVLGCARQVPEEVNDVNRALGQARDACASVYAADALADVERDIRGMNDLADRKKYKKARRQAEPLLPRIRSLNEQAQAARSEARSAAEVALRGAESAVDAARAEDAATHASADFQAASSKLAEAREKMNDPCAYRDVVPAAEEAKRLAEKASSAAAAEKRRLEEERLRREEEERRRREEEERRRREEELARKPPVWNVSRGESLWAIAGNERGYGDPTLWPLIFDANRDKITDPNLIYPGQELKIPRGMSEQEMQKRLYDLWRSMSR